MMLGYLLARKGIQVTVLEKDKDFFRDFRGDTVHPSTMEVLYELGILDDFLAMPHQEIKHVNVSIGGLEMPLADCSHLPTHAKFIALMPQWDFLNFLAKHAAQYPNFNLRLEHNVTHLIEEDGRVVGVHAETPGGPIEIRSELVVGCDGRHSTSRSEAHLRVIDTGVPIDVLWFRLSKHASDPQTTLGNVNYGALLVQIDRAEYYQCAFVIAKNSFLTEVQPAGLDAFRRRIALVAPILADRVAELTDWEQVKLLSVQINRLERWHLPGLLCIGDAAHAMSPVGGIGINLAIQDAVATANILAEPLASGIVTEIALAHVQHRRELPTRITQSFQAQVHRVLSRVLDHSGPVRPPWLLPVLTAWKPLRYLLARFIGMGVRPEHIRP
jgi:2-polyprenyl-6-methoxyphenol hydroxylase-like FAD-dependent oxidoreductase